MTSLAAVITPTMPVKTFLCFVPVLLCVSLYGQHAYLKVGASFTYTFSSHYNTGHELASNKSETYRFEIMRRDDSGYYRISCTLVDFNRVAPGQQPVNNNPADNPYNSTDDVASTALLYQPFELVVD